MPMVRRICRPETSITGVFEDFAISMVLLFGGYGAHGIATTPTGATNRNGS